MGESPKFVAPTPARRSAFSLALLVSSSILATFFASFSAFFLSFSAFFALFFSDVSADVAACCFGGGLFFLSLFLGGPKSLPVSSLNSACSGVRGVETVTRGH